MKYLKIDENLTAVIFDKQESNDVREALYTTVQSLDQLAAIPETKADEALFTRVTNRADRVEKLFESFKELNH